MTEMIKLSAPLQLSESPDTEKRTITGYAYTTDTEFDAMTSEGEFGKFKFAANAIKPWREHVPVYAFHNENDPVGRLTASEWDEEAKGWKVTLSIAPTARGDEMLTLAAHGTIGGLSMLTSFDDFDEEDGVTVIKSGACREISLVSHPAVPTAVLTSVALKATNESPKETDMTDNPVADTVELSAPQGPTPQPIPLVGVTHEESPYPHLVGLSAKPEHSLIADIRLSAQDPAAAERVQRHLRLAVTTADLPPGEGPTRNDLMVMPREATSPLAGVVSTGSIQDDTPFYVPRYSTAGEANLLNPHVEGVEPVLGELGTFGRQLVTPGAESGKIAITREAFLAKISPTAEQIYIQRVEAERRRKVISSLGTFLDALPTTGADAIATVSIAGSTPVDALIDAQLNVSTGANAGRYNRVLFSAAAYSALVGQKDNTGRRLLAPVNPSNADGSFSANYQAVDINGTVGVPVAGLTNSYLVDTTALWHWTSPVMNFTFDYEVAWVRLGAFQFVASALIDAGGVVRLTR